MAQRKAIDLGVSVGDVILDKYRVEAILGHGGMGVVAQCIHLQLGERVAIKMLRPDVLGDADAVERFQREAQAAAKLRSEYVARVTDVGTFSATHVPYMVMEFLEGNDLDHLIQERGHLPVPWAVELMLQAAEALAEAHSINIVHRDVKPSNLFVTWRPDGSALIKVLDFGISKSPMGTDMQLTQTQSLLGTPAYMSPEQMRSARMVDGRTDIWSLGTVMYEVIEGRRPFEADSFSEMCVKVAVDQPAPMTIAPPALQQVVMRCLAKVPDQRYASMAELGRDLIPFAQDVPQAQMLVERMLRMLRRSHGGDWESVATGGIMPVRDRSAPVALQQLHDRSGPISMQQGSMQQGSMQQPVAVTPLPGSLQRPYARPEIETTIATPRRSKRVVVWTAIAIVAAIGGIAIGIVSGRASGDRTAQAPPAVAQPMVVTVPVDASLAVAPAIDAAVAPVAVVEDPKPATRLPPPVKKPPVAPPKGTAKTVAKTKPSDPVPVATPPPVAPVVHCDPFSSRNSDCAKKP